MKLSLALYSACHRVFLANRDNFRELLFLLAAVRCVSWQQVTLVRVDWLLKQVMCVTLQSWPLPTTASAGDTVSRLVDQFTPLQLSLLFHLDVNLWCKLDLKEGVCSSPLCYLDGT